MIFTNANQKKFDLKKHALIFGGAALFAIFLFGAKTVFAFDADGVKGAATAGLEDLLSFVSGTIIWVLAALASLWLTTTALQWLINNQTSLINFNNGFISHGLAVTQGLADLLLLLAFVVAAFCIILKLWDFEAKKIIPKLIFAAIATRFGVLLVKMMVDIGNVAINTIMANNGDLLSKATYDLMSGAIFSIATTLAAMAALMVSYAIPVVNLLSIGATIGSIATAAATILGINTDPALGAIGNATIYFATNFVAKGIFQIFACTILSGIFLSYIVLFVSRIFMLQILAVISPLAIMAYGLPQTRRYFGDWWKSLVKWTFAGVWVLFFLVLGLGSADFILSKNYETDAVTDVKALEGIHMDNTMFYYLFLIVYLALVKSMAGSDAVMAEMFRTAMVGAGAVAYSHVVKPTLSGARKGAMRSYEDADKRIGTDKEHFYDKTVKHISGLTANIANEKTMSTWRGAFSGDPNKVSEIGEKAGKTWNIRKYKKFSDIGSLIKEEVKEAGKDKTIEDIMAKGANASSEEAVWAMQTAKSEDLPDLISGFGKNTGRDLDYAVKYGLIKPGVMEAAARSGGLESSQQLRDYYKKQDKQDLQLTKVEKFANATPSTLSPQAQAEENEKMRARVMSLKSATVRRDTFKKLPDSVFADNKNIQAMLISGGTDMIGYSRSINKETYKKIAAVAKDNFKGLAKANPDLVRAMAQDPNDINGYGAFIPDDIKQQAENDYQRRGDITYNEALKEIVEGLT
ncbi:MAG: hypothetical protein L7H18_05790 [Candidatus Nealsonbacteria bacterium DGGOD1a]|nr:MAG: hypothetical protein L7H18_05790 [Candidatus Nealsonbacteria bacterium DGGOD1a]